MEDKSADYLILTARKHLFLINNVHPVCLFLKEKLKDFDVDNATIASSSSFANTAMVRFLPSFHFFYLFIILHFFLLCFREKARTEMQPNDWLVYTARLRVGICYFFILANFGCVYFVWYARMLSEQTLFCERIALAVGLHSKDMQSFSLMYEGQKSQQARILKAKFNVSILLVFDMLCNYYEVLASGL